MNKLKLFVSFVFSLLIFIFTPLTLAGGPMVSLEADSYGATNSDGTYGRIMRVVSQARPCEGTEVTFQFVDPKDGDYIMTSSGNATFVFTKDRQPYYKNGEVVCGTTAKMGSKVKGERMVTVIAKYGGVLIDQHPPVIKVDFDGQYHGNNSYDDYNYSSSQDDPYYSMVSKPTSTPTPAPNEGKIIPSQNPKLTPPPVVIEKNNNELLTQKIASLEAKLSQSEHKQSLLEQRINSLVSFIKNLFPFFK